MSTASLPDKKKSSLARAFEALQAGPIYNQRPSISSAKSPSLDIQPSSPTIATSDDPVNVTASMTTRQRPGSSISAGAVKIPASRQAKTKPKAKVKSKSKAKLQKKIGGSKSIGDGSLPDEERCRRSDGKDWRCKNPRVEGLSFCVNHASRFKKADASASLLAAKPRGIQITKRPTAKRAPSASPIVPPAVPAKRVREGMNTRKQAQDVADSPEPATAEDEDVEVVASESDVERTLKLYWSPESLVSWQVQLYLHERGLKFEAYSIEDLANESTETQEIFGKKRYRSKVPIVLDGDVMLSEPAAIFHYLEWVHSHREPTLLPVDREVRGDVLQRLEESFALQRALDELLRVKGNEKTEEEDEKSYRRSILVEELKHWETVLEEESGFVVGDAVTLVDTVLYPILVRMISCGLDVSKEEFSKLARYYDSWKVRPSAANIAAMAEATKNLADALIEV